jgi:hypothetical protein
MSDIISIAHRHGEDDRILAKETADCLRKWLELAESGELISVALAGEMTNGDVCTGFSAAARRYQVIGGLETVKQQIVSQHLEGG